MSAERAAEVLRRGGVIAYPTEGVFGLGCLPDNPGAVQRVLDIKKRDASKGLILIAANAGQLAAYVALPEGQHIPAADPARPVTWIVAAGEKTSELVRGEHAGVAVRITSHPVARAICAAVDSPLISTSANLSGQNVVQDAAELRDTFAALVDYIVPGECGPSLGPSEIRDFASGRILRPYLPSTSN